jgi:hypothetical protein
VKTGIVTAESTNRTADKFYSIERVGRFRLEALKDGSDRRSGIILAERLSDGE